MGRQCYLCDYKQRRGDTDVSLHTFPKDAAVRTAWFRVCGLKEGFDDVSGVRICSKHFTDRDFFPLRSRATKMVKTLRPGSIPSKLKVHGVRQTVVSTSCKAVEGVETVEGIKSDVASGCGQSLLQAGVNDDSQQEEITEEDTSTKDETFYASDIVQKTNISVDVSQKGDLFEEADTYIQCFNE